MTWNGEMALILRYFAEFGSFRAHCVKVVDKAITIVSLRLLWLLVGLNVCRGTARRPRYKFLADQSINQSKRIYIAPYVAGESEARNS